MKDGLLGLSIGEAFGVQLDGELPNRSNPITYMSEYRSYDVSVGGYSDDTCMCLCVMDSYIKNKEFNYKDIMDNMCDWVNTNKYSSSDSLFDISKTVRFSLMNYWKNKDIELSGIGGDDKQDASCLSRVLPVAVYVNKNKIKDIDLYNIIRNLTNITHSNEISFLGAFILTKYLVYILGGLDSNKALSALKRYKYEKFFNDNTIDKYNRILRDDIKKYNFSEININNNIVSVLESVFWIIENTDNYKDAVIASGIIGGANGVRGSITGMIAGIIYSKKNIPKEWLELLKRKDYLEKMIRKYNVLI